MRRVFLAMALAALPALADEAAEKLAVMRTVLALNELPERQSVFTDDASVDPEFHRLWNGRPMQARPIDRPADRTTARPTVTISHEPWGEATIGIPPVRFEIANPRVVTDAVRLVTEDVALADAASVYDGEHGRERRRLFLVLKKSAGAWKIAALRVVDAGPRPLE